MNIPPDIVNRVQRDFPHDSGTVLARLLELRREVGDFASDRLIRCLVFAARGDTSRIEPLIECARNDPRDLIVSGECEDWKTVRDLTQPFLA